MHSNVADLSRLSAMDQNKLALLEQDLQQTLFVSDTHGGAQGIQAVVEWAKNKPQDDTDRQYQLGCGTPFACGE